MANLYWAGTANTWQVGSNWVPTITGGVPSGIPPGVGDTAYISANMVRLTIGPVGASMLLQMSKTYATYASVTVAFVSGTPEGWSNVGDAWTYTYNAYSTWYYAAMSIPGAAPFVITSFSGDPSTTIGGNVSPTTFSASSTTVTNFDPTLSLNEVGFLGTETRGMTLAGSDFSVSTISVEAGAGPATLTAKALAYVVTHAGANTLTLANASTVIINLSASGAGSVVCAGTLYVGSSSGFGTTDFFLGGSGAGTVTVNALSWLGPNPNLSLQGNVTLGSLGGEDVGFSGTLTIGGGSVGQATGGGTIIVTGNFTFSKYVNLTAAISIGTGRTVTSNSSLGLGQTFSGAISGLGTLVKTGSDTMTLSGTNSHAATTLSQGTMKTSNTAALGTGPVSVAAGTTLQTSTAQPKLTLGGKLTLTGGIIRIGG